VTDRTAHLVITGTYRSGTTLAERLVDNSPDASCAPQPFPYLYLEAKRRFLRQTGHAVPHYPIGTGFHDPAHAPDELASFLRSDVIDRATIDETFRAMHDYSGAQTPEVGDVIDQLPAGTLVEVVTALQSRLADRRRPGATLHASKEILVEEFVPALLDAGVRTLVVVRDPRTVVASTFGPAADAWTGAPRPLLYTIRLWRKSVAYALRYQHGVAQVRFEDLVRDGAATLRNALRELAIDADASPADPLLDAQGRVWAPNTSFPDRADRAGFGLSERQLAYVEALAGPEMAKLGYPRLTDGAGAEGALEAFRPEEDPGRDHPAFERDLSVDPEQLSLERERLRLLEPGESPADEATWFVLPGVRDRLASAATKPTGGGTAA
jgi:hypothetical protein